MYINGEEIPVSTWKAAAKVLFNECCKTKHKELKALCGNYYGRRRLLIDSKPDTLQEPVEVGGDIYFETRYGAETLLNVMFDIFRTVEFDYSEILVVLK